MKTVRLVGVLNKSENRLPEYATEGAYAMDLRSNEDVVIHPGQTVIVKTGLFVEVPEGFALRIVSRSGMASKGIIVSNAPGTVDEDYRGEVGVIITNTRNPLLQAMINNPDMELGNMVYNDIQSAQFVIKKGDRIAQCYIDIKHNFKFIPVDSLSDTSRGEGGFGSSGVK